MFFIFYFNIIKIILIIYFLIIEKNFFNYFSFNFLIINSTLEKKNSNKIHQKLLMNNGLFFLLMKDKICNLEHIL